MKGAEPRLDEVGAAIRAAAHEVHAPAGLHERVAAERRPRRRAPALAAGLATVALGLVLALVLAADDAPPPALAQATAAALGPATAAAPARDPRRPALLRAEIGGVRFPRWEHGFAWRASGRSDGRVAGRRATTVFYLAPDGRRIGYVVVAGAALALPAGERRVVRAGTAFAIRRTGDATVLTWERGGRTCVLAGRRVSAERLLALATWDGSARASRVGRGAYAGSIPAPRAS